MAEPVARPLRPGLADLVVLTLGCGLGLGAYQRITPRWAMVPGRAQLLMLLYNSGMSLAFGIILAGVVALARRWRQGERQGPLWPGHWLLVFGMFASLADLAAVVVFYALDISWSRPVARFDPFWILLNLSSLPHLPTLFHQLVGWGLGTGFSVGFAWFLFRRVRFAWFLVFVAFGLVASTFTGAAAWVMIALGRGSRTSEILDTYQEWAIMLYRYSILGCSSTIILAIVLDLPDRLRRDLFHWAGITAWLLVAGCQWVIY